MKTTSVLASLFLGSLAAAIPVNKRDLYTKTEVVVETQIIYTTVYEGYPPAAPTEAVSTPAELYPEPSSEPASSQAEPTSSPAFTPPVVEVPSSSSVFTPPPVVSTPTPTPEPSTPSPTPTPTPSPEPTPEPQPTPEPSPEPTPEPEPTTPAYTPAPVSSAPAAVATEASSSGGSSSGGETFEGEITVYDTQGGFGACGKQLSDDMYICALAADTMGASTYDVATGNPTNQWCGKKVTVEYEGKTVQCTVEDKCPGCKPGSLDLSRAAWNDLTGSLGGMAGDRVPAKWFSS